MTGSCSCATEMLTVNDKGGCSENINFVAKKSLLIRFSTPGLVWVSHLTITDLTKYTSTGFMLMTILFECHCAGACFCVLI